MDNRIQTVVLVLTDGRRGRFSGPAFLETDEIGRVGVVDVEITSPSELPPDMHFEEIQTGSSDVQNSPAPELELVPENAQLAFDFDN